MQRGEQRRPAGAWRVWSCLMLAAGLAACGDASVAGSGGPEDTAAAQREFDRLHALEAGCCRAADGAQP
ncbi:hypothetical protein [Solimonas variicoloris]|uniref:hypothetical protein n=1 Tax=Solimonas variicoloris TaxID=254408 RepID=UPI0012B6425A|nr:hypothetical protein [Solimonas variicoloris]